MRPRVEDLMVFSYFGSYDPQYPNGGRAGAKGAIIYLETVFFQD
jgi:hypothetical protein